MTLRIALSLALVATACAAPPLATYPVVRRDDVTIERSAYGVATVKGQTDAAVAYGVAVATAEDSFVTVQKQLLAVRGRLGRHDGIEGAKADFLGEVLEVRRVVAAHYDADLAPQTRRFVEAYADGLNAYAAAHAGRIIDRTLFPVTGRDVVGGFVLTSPLFFGLDEAIGALVEGHLPPRKSVGDSRGSNAFAIAPSKSADGATRLLLNSHQPWSGPVAWSQIAVESGDGWRFSGAIFPGSPVPFNGHNDRLGWANTINRPDIYDVYRLTLDARKAVYRFGGGWRPLGKRRVVLHVKLGPVVLPVPRTLYRSVHGPVFVKGRLAYALRWPDMENVRQVEEYIALAKAQDFDSFRRALAIQAVPATNFIYADATGRIALFYNASFPDRPKGLDTGGAVQGDDPALVWSGKLPPAATPALIDPPAGYIVNANNTPLLATAAADDLKPGSIDPRVRLETLVTNRVLRARRLLDAKAKISRDDLLSIKFDKGYEKESALGATILRLQSTPVATEDARAAQALLRTWDWTLDGDGAADTLTAMLIRAWNRAFWRHVAPPADEAALARTARFLKKHYGRLDPALGEALRLRRGDVDLPLSGGPDALRAIGWEEGKDGRLVADFGDSFVMLVEWDQGGRVKAATVSPFGAATEDKASPHYADQAPNFAKEILTPIAF